MPADPAALKLYGGIGSPYTMKVRAALRRMRLDHVFILIDDAAAKRTAEVRPPIIPVLEHADGRFETDSTPMLQRLAAAHPAAPAIYPENQAERFLALLIEDFADEWLTKAMFHFRWAYEADAELLSRQLAFDRLRSAGVDALEDAAAWFKDRQIARMTIVGCTAETAGLIEAGFERVCAALNAHVSTHAPFLFGSGPSVADFALYGQLFQLQRDPTPGERMRNTSPWLQRWIEWVDDAAGFEGAPQRLDASGPLRGLMDEIGAVYLPFLAANAASFNAGQSQFECAIRGGVWRQPVFKYQVKCLNALRESYEALDVASRARIGEALNADAAIEILS
ncbi:MAG: glutathione S-transferase C-terminal domain-containing protein [Pseudomonadota bacterium]